MSAGTGEAAPQTALMNPDQCLALQLADRLNVNGDCPTTAAALRKYSSTTLLRRALEVLERAVPHVSDDLVQRLALIPADGSTPSVNKATAICHKLIVAAQQMDVLSLDVQTLVVKKTWVANELPTLRHISALLLESAHARKSPLIRAFFGLNSLSRCATLLHRYAMRVRTLQLMRGAFACCVVRPSVVSCYRRLTAGKGSVKVRLLLVANAVGLLNDDAFLAAGIVTTSPADALERSPFMKYQFRKQCDAALELWGELSSSIMADGCARGLLELAGSTTGQPVEYQLASLVAEEGNQHADAGTTPSTPPSVDVSSPPMDDLMTDEGPPVDEVDVPPREDLDFSLFAQPLAATLMMALWRAVDLNENEQCGKRVHVFWEGDNRWCAHLPSCPAASFCLTLLAVHLFCDQVRRPNYRVRLTT